MTRTNKIDARAFAGQVEDGELEILPWRSGSKNTGALRAVRVGLDAVAQSLAHRDLILTTEDAKWQIVSASPLANCH